MAAPMKIWNASVGELPQVAQEIVDSILKFSPKNFVLWLKGDLGAGKTTLSGEILHAFGLPAEVPVLSPTFTYLTEYRTSRGVIAHMDLYRLVEGDDDSVSGFLEGRSFFGLIVEWPERALNSEFIEMTHQVELKRLDNPDTRKIIFSQQD